MPEVDGLGVIPDLYPWQKTLTAALIIALDMYDMEGIDAAVYSTKLVGREIVYIPYAKRRFGLDGFYHV